MSNSGKVNCRVEKMVIPTYPEPEKEKLPMYCENRCHQRTSGRVYPNPVVKAVVRDHKVDQEHTAIVLENDFIELIILPDIGGRIFGAKDKSNGYDFFYRQNVIKPALIGMLGSWLSGGAEFNWPMHHRPSTYLPTDYFIENSKDGSVTVWLSEHEPMDRMKGMVGIRLHPNKAMFETRARVFNRTELPQSFLWWENIAVPVNEDYQIFFPQDVNHVHFHRKQSVTEYPITNRGMYNGKDYRGDPRDIRWHKNTREATSYFSAKSNFDFFGGYDHGKKAGVVHVANHHVSPGKKLFTWAYDQLSESWENALTDTDGAYAELMAGCYSDNQPDFSWLEVGESKEFSQFWYPIKELGEPLNANTSAALNFCLDSGVLNIYAVENFKSATIEITDGGKLIKTLNIDLSIGKTTSLEVAELKSCTQDSVKVKLISESGKEIISFSKPEPATPVIPEPRPVDPSPYSLDNSDDLYLTGLHMKQYRDALTKPDVYWKRALELNPMHYRAANGLGWSALNDFRFDEAENYFRQSIETQLKYNPNPREGEAYYNLGLSLKMQGKIDDAYDAFYKATWNYRWRSQGFYKIATIDCMRGDFEKAKEHLFEALESYAGNQKANNLLAVVEKRLRNNPAELLKKNLARDPLDYWALNENGADFYEIMTSDPSQTILDIAYDYTDSGLYTEAAQMLEKFISHFEEINPMVLYTLDWIYEKMSETEKAAKIYSVAGIANPDYCFPARAEEMKILEHIAVSTGSARAAYYLGNLYYGKEHYEEAIAQWEFALNNGENYYVLYRNLGMAYFNNRRDNEKALEFVRKAYDICPKDAALIFDYNHLLLLSNSPASERIELLERDPELLQERDDLYLELVRAYNNLGNCKTAIELLKTHTFTPCEGGEHAIIEQYTFAHFRLGRLALEDGKAKEAAGYFKDGQVFPKNLGAGVWNIAMNVPCKYYEAVALEQTGNEDQAKKLFEEIVNMGTDFFTFMYQPAFNCYLAMALKKLGREKEADELLEKSIAEWTAKAAEKDYGYFQLTPFFLSFLERPEDARAQFCNYLLGLASTVKQDQDSATRYFDKALSINSSHLMAGLEKELLTAKAAI